MRVPEFIEDLVRAGLEITIGHHDDYGIYFDVNTGMKSHCHLAYNEEDKLIAHMRYNVKETIEDFESLCYAVKSCMCGRDYLNHIWADILVDEGLLQKHVKTTTTYS